MGHLVNAKDELYHALAERLDKTPEGVVINEELLGILRSLYTESEAMVGSKLPLTPVSLKQISTLTGFNEDELKITLDEMSMKGLIIDIPRKGECYYIMTPVVVGFFEYTFMRTGNKVQLKELAELFENYFESNGVYKQIAGKDTKMMRNLVYESLIPVAVETEVLDYEKAEEIIREAGGGSLSVCQCRHQAAHLGTACDAPEEVCMSFGGAAKWLISKGLARPATTEELLKILKETQEYGLVHLCDNVLDKPTYICSCCSCCCHMLRGIKEHEASTVQPSNFIPSLEIESCVSCGICADKCPINAITMTDQGNGKEVPVVDSELCIGCGVCASFCPTDSLTMSRREVLYVPPKNIKEKLKRLTTEREK